MPWSPRVPPRSLPRRSTRPGTGTRSTFRHALASALRTLAPWTLPEPETPTGPVDDGRLDLRSLSTAMGAWGAAWLLVQHDPRLSFVLTTALGALLTLLYWLLLRNRGLIAWSHHWWTPVAAAGVGVFVVVAGISTHTLARQDPTFGALADAATTIRFEATVTGDARTIDRTAGTASHETIVGHQQGTAKSDPSILVEVLVRRYSAAGSWHAGAADAILVLRANQLHQHAMPTRGQSLSGLGRLSRAEPGDRQGYWLRASAVLTSSHGHGRPLPTERWRDRFAAGSAVLPGEGPALLPGMVMGDRTAQSDELSTDMKTAGLAHLTAVSGANVAMLMGTVLWACRFCSIGRWPALCCSLLMLAGFVVLVHPEPSVIRAAVMGSIGALAVYAGRGRQALTALCVCVVVILAWDPWYAREPAFQLSALATAGIVLMGQRLAKLGRRFLPGWLADGVAVSTSAQLFCLPVLVGLAPAFSLYSVPANVVVAPLVPVVTVLGTAGLVLCALPGPWSQPFIWVAGLPASWIGALGHLVAGLPSALLPWPEGSGGRVAALLVAMLGLVSVWLAATPAPDEDPGEGRWAAPGLGGAVHRLGHALAVPLAGWGRRSAAAAAGLAGIGLLAGVTMPATAWLPTHPGPWQVAACDVGQGDAFALRTGIDSAVLVDTGPDPTAVDDCLTGLGVHTIDALFVTHLHADHAGGVAGAVAGRELKAAYFSTGTGRTDLPGLPAGHHASEPEAGATGAAGPVSWTVIGPIGDPAGEEENDASLVIVFRIAAATGRTFTMLATGDMEAAAMGEVLRANPRLRVDVLKVSHHGAKNGGSEIIAACDARVALIGVGADNSYGHPTSTTLEALQAAGMQTFRTDLNGTIRLHATPEADLVVNGRPAR